MTKSTMVPSISLMLLGIDEHLDATILEHQVTGVRLVSIIDDVRKSGAAGLAHPEAQAHAVAATAEERFDPIGSGFSQRNSHRFRRSSIEGGVILRPFRPTPDTSLYSIFDHQQTAEFLDRDAVVCRPISRGSWLQSIVDFCRAATSPSMPLQPEYGGIRTLENGHLSQHRPRRANESGSSVLTRRAGLAAHYGAVRP